MKYSEIDKNCKALINVSNKRFPRKLTTVIARNITKLQPIVEEIDKQKNAIALAYVKKTEDGNLDVEKNDNGLVALKFENVDYKQKFESEMSDLLEMDENIELLSINESDLELLDMAEFDCITSAEEISLGFMIQYQD